MMAFSQGYMNGTRDMLGVMVDWRASGTTLAEYRETKGDERDE